ncbi:response regulator transcription factor [Sedimentibacter hydroxybenzoicus DSM 7310]|uniref:Response regulator transcription factor n=1 Tax=Sedimentibacter hydroxybenzoicus DSM 7310 TaxID=1123245 RepID=A0A974BKI3_SEDHY|nr:LytTR family DNA-binding domain-containing protein [Sedimentibacter hydroxybenzoicus]NYB74985.1 response regulator transcription factor [Sedimentibacter hydroxybenzoicus DSM 7310]
MLKIALCDDNNDTITKYAELISELAEKYKIQIEISCFNSGESLLFHYGYIQEQIDIIYLDILMDKTDGMETARKLRDNGCKAQIIFLTSYEDYVYEAFEVNAAHYLIKEDTSKEKFENVFLKAVERVSENKEELFAFKFEGKTTVIPVRDISYFEIWKRVVTVYYGNGESAKFYYSIERLENELSRKNFVRVHRSYLVNLSYIEILQNQSIKLKIGAVIPVGVTYMESLKSSLSDYISRFHIFNATKLNNGDGSL